MSVSVLTSASANSITVGVNGSSMTCSVTSTSCTVSATNVVTIQKNNFFEDPLAEWFISRESWKYVPLISEICNGKNVNEISKQAAEKPFSFGTLPAILYGARCDDDKFNSYIQTIIGAVMRDVEQHNNRLPKEQHYNVTPIVVEGFLNALVSVADRAINGSCCVML